MTRLEALRKTKLLKPAASLRSFHINKAVNCLFPNAAIEQNFAVLRLTGCYGRKMLAY